MTDLRQKMIRAMELKNLSDNTQRAYLAGVTGIASYYNQSPEKLTKEKIEDYLLSLKHDKGNAPNSCYSVLTGLRFFCKYVTEKQIPVTYSIRRTTRKLPQVLTMEEIWKIICSTNNLKHRLILMTTYSAGLRASETINLKAENIDSKRMLIKVIGKTRKAIEKAKDGDMTAIRLCLDRMVPPVKDKPVSFDLPVIDSAQDAARAVGAVLRAVADGDLTPIEAAEVSKIVSTYVAALEASELEQRIAKLEATRNATDKGA